MKDSRMGLKANCLRAGQDEGNASGNGMHLLSLKLIYQTLDLCISQDDGEGDDLNLDIM